MLNVHVATWCNHTTMVTFCVGIRKYDFCARNRYLGQSALVAITAANRKLFVVTWARSRLRD